MTNQEFLEKLSKEVKSWEPCLNCNEKVSYELLKNDGRTGINGCVKCL